jgi:Protein of unknown function (DUF1524)
MIRSRWWIPVAAIVVALAIVALAIGQPRSPTLASATGSPTTSAIAGGSTAPSGSASPLESAASLAPVTPAPTLPVPSFGTSETLAQLVALLRVAPEHRDGYQRSLFVHWIDADGDGCDTRREVLIAEAVIAPSVGARCALTGGRWFSLYDGLFFTDSSKLQIDHVVALAEAWDSGAWTWTPDRRKAYANDLDVPWPLIAVSGTTNQSKSDKDPAEWLPPAPAAECPFLSAWIATKVRWDLAVDPAERAALETDIATCPASVMPYDPVGPAGEYAGATPAPGGTPTPLPSTAAGCDPAYPTVCIPPPPPDLDCGDIPYRNFKVLPPDPHRFDGDGDGIGCET